MQITPIIKLKNFKEINRHYRSSQYMSFFKELYDSGSELKGCPVAVYVAADPEKKKTLCAVFYWLTVWQKDVEICPYCFSFYQASYFAQWSVEPLPRTKPAFFSAVGAFKPLAYAGCDADSDALIPADDCRKHHTLKKT